MKLLAFSVYDEKAGVFGVPFCMAHRGLAIRAFSDLVADVNTTVHKHPSDFKLYTIGEFDDNSGALISLSQPEFLQNASDFVQKGELNG